MANDFYTYTPGTYTKGTKARAEVVEADFQALETGLTKLPTEAQQNRGSRNYIATDTGAADAYAGSLTHVSGSYGESQDVFLLIANTNTGASTLNVSGIGATAIVHADGTALIANDLTAGYIGHFKHNGTVWQLMNHSPASATAAAASAVAAAASAAAAATSETNAGTSETNAAASAVAAAASAAEYGTEFPNVNGVVAATDEELSLLSGRSLASTDDVIDNFPVGTLMLFQQTAAPTGWTKQTTHNDKTLRVVSGAAGSGGTSAFSTVFAKTATDSYTLLAADIPSHTHTFTGDAVAAHTHTITPISDFETVGSSAESLTRATTRAATTDSATASGGGHTPTGTNAATGGGGGHTHGMDIRVQYVDLIICSKN